MAAPNIGAAPVARAADGHPRFVEASQDGAALPMPHVDGVRHRFAIVGGVRVHYAEAGEGEPIVLLHGWPQHWWSFRKIIGPLARKYRVICPDIRGLGWSAGSTAGYRFIELAADLVGLLDALDLQRVRLVGHDWGQLAGYTACLRWPERIEKFIALAGVTPWSADGAPWRLYLRPWHIWTIAMLGRFATERLALPERALRTWRHVGRFTPEEVQTYLGPLRRPEAQDATVRFDRGVLFQELPYFWRNYERVRLRTSTLHLNGAEDPLTIGVPQTYQRYTDDMRLELIPNCGHFIAEERPEELVDRIEEFFGR